MTTIPEILSGAAAIIERNGHNPHSSGYPGGPRCVIGAMAEITKDDVLMCSPAVEFMRKHLAGPGATRYEIEDTFVSHWSDSSDQWTVVQTLREAAKEAQEQGL